MNRLTPSATATAGLAALCVLGLSACAADTAGGASVDPWDALGYTGVPLTATLSGAAEAPSTGDPNGSGRFGMWVDTAGDRVCYALGVSGIATASAAHVHRGAAGTSGPPVVTLEAPAGLESHGCAAVDGALADELVADPSAFYVNVHNADYPGGAVRGQLKRS